MKYQSEPVLLTSKPVLFALSLEEVQSPLPSMQCWFPELKSMHDLYNVRDSTVTLCKWACLLNQAKLPELHANLKTLCHLWDANRRRCQLTSQVPCAYCGSLSYRYLRNPEGLAKNPETWSPGVPESRNPEFQKSGNPEVLNPGISWIRFFLKIRISANPGTHKSGNPDLFHSVNLVIFELAPGTCEMSPLL